MAQSITYRQTVTWYERHHYRLRVAVNADRWLAKIKIHAPRLRCTGRPCDQFKPSRYTTIKCHTTRRQGRRRAVAGVAAGPRHRPDAKERRHSEWRCRTKVTSRAPRASDHAPVWSCTTRSTACVELSPRPRLSVDSAASFEVVETHTIRLMINAQAGGPRPVHPRGLAHQ